VIGVSVPAAGRSRRGAGESYGVAAHRRRAWLGGGSPLPETAPEPYSSSVGSSESGYSLYFLPPPLHS